jgi:hypothetical protein
MDGIGRAWLARDVAQQKLSMNAIAAKLGIGTVHQALAAEKRSA